MELLEKIYRLEIKVKGLTQHLMSGEYHSAFKGRGMAFSETRNYQFGDDVRTIDWNVTARFNDPYVKVFEEERELVMMIVVDVSASQYFGSSEQTKYSAQTEVIAILAFSALSNNDKVGAVFVSDRIEKYMPPKKGRKHILSILQELMTLQPSSEKTKIVEGLKFVQNIQKKRTICFVISDFIEDDSRFIEALRITRRKHDVVAIKIEDKYEYKLPKIGFVQLYNAETKQTTWINTNDVNVRQRFEANFNNKKQQLIKQFVKNDIDYVILNTETDLVLPIVKLFRMRGSRR